MSSFNPSLPERLQELSHTDFNDHWLVPDGKGFVKAIPKDNWLKRTINSDPSVMRENLKTSVEIIEKTLRKHPDLWKETKNLEALLHLETHLLEISTKMTPSIAYSIQRILEVTKNHALLVSTDSNKHSLGNDKQKNICVDKLKELQTQMVKQTAKDSVGSLQKLVEEKLYFEDSLESDKDNSLSQDQESFQEDRDKSTHVDHPKGSKSEELVLQGPNIQENAVENTTATSIQPKISFPISDENLEIAQVLCADPPIQQISFATEEDEEKYYAEVFAFDDNYDDALSKAESAGEAHEIINYIINNKPNIMRNNPKLAKALFTDCYDVEIILNYLVSKKLNEPYYVTEIVSHICKYSGIKSEKLARVIPSYLPANIVVDHLSSIKDAKESPLGLSMLNELYKNEKLDKKTFFECLHRYDIWALSKVLDKELLVEYAKSFKKGIADGLFFSFFDPTHFKLLEDLIKLGLPFTSGTVVFALQSQNYRCIDLILKKIIEQNKIEQNTHIILRELMQLEDSNLANHILKLYPPLTSKCPLDLLEKAILMGNGWFVDLVINDLEITPEEINKLLPFALKSNNLNIIKKLCAKNPDLPPNLSYPQILGLNKISNQTLLANQITSYAIMSPLKDLYELAKNYPQIATVLPKALEKASLVVRFSNLSHPTEINQNNANAHTYLEGTLKYAEENVEFVELLHKQTPQLSEITRDELLTTIMKNRHSRLPATLAIGAREAYVTKQINKESRAKTPLNLISLGEGSIVSSVKSNRYLASFKHLTETCFDWKKMDWSPGSYPSIKRIEDQIYYSYSDKSLNESYPTTILNFGRESIEWLHTNAEVIKKLQGHLETLHNEILKFPLDYSNDESRTQFFEKVARGYWLIATLCETHRGTPHNSMMWLNLIYEHHGLPPPIPLQEHFFLDNTMLMIPYEEAIKKWESFFEPTIDQSLSVKSPEEKLTLEETVAVMKPLIEKNGMMLRLCSPEIRNNEQLVRLAIKQNPGAKIYASKHVKDLVEANKS